MKMAPQKNTLKLPKAILDQIGGEDALSAGGRKSKGRQGSRKELRKAARSEKKSLRGGPPPAKRFKIQDNGKSTSSFQVEDTNEEEPVRRKVPAKRAEVEDEPKPKSILKKTKKADPKPDKEDEGRSVSPPVRVSRAVKDKLAEDDEEIAFLEKKLGLKGKKKLPQSFTDDGLDELLEGLGEDEEVVEKKKRKAEGDEWLEQKRAQARKRKEDGPAAPTEDDEDEAEEDTDDADEDMDDDGEVPSDDDGASDMSLDGPEFPDDLSEEDESELGDEVGSLDADNDFDGFSEEEGEASHPKTRVRENPYVAPSTGGAASAGKYIPPSLRKASTSDSEELIRLRRRTQGLINRLTEANLISILADIEGLYRDNPRQHVTSTLVDILLTSVCEPTSLPDTLIILPAGFIAAIYKVVGTDFGAQVIQRITELFDEHYVRAVAQSTDGPAAATSDSSKETSNLIMLLSEMYNFQVVGSNLIFDYVRLFLGKLSELNAELLLKIIRTSGPQLRQDDPSSLKDIVAMLRPAVASVGEDNISVRTKFMIETINDLKNNKMKTGGVASAVTSEHTIRMKKILGTLNTRNLKASEPLRIGLKDIQESDKKGKWWLVGASWVGKDAEETELPKSTSASKAPVEDQGTSDLAQLAREHRMNTDIRRAIFITIMSASDFQDAHMRLMKLQLKKVQEFEIPKVLIHCAGAEKAYNPYYTLIAKKICGDRRLKTAFQYCLWDLFKKMGESDDDEEVAEDDEDALDTRHIVNLAKMFGTLMIEGAVGLSALKNLNLSYLQPKTKNFLEILFITVFLQSQKSAGKKRDEATIVNLFSKVKDTPQIIRGLQYFLKKVVRKTDIAGGEEEKATVKWACKIAGESLEALALGDSTAVQE